MPGKWIVGETEEDTEDSGFDLLGQIEKALQDPKVQARIYQNAKAQGVPPEILQSLMPGNELNPGDVIEALENQQSDNVPPESVAQDDKVRDAAGIPAEERGIATETDDATNDTTMPTQTDTQEFDAEKLLDIIDQIIEVHGEDTTLGEFRDWAEQNTDIIENFADQMV